ncbi:MOSC domain-containing protein [Deinococcus irradiatisoli]|uniref:MOSC domain-containing protein n=1 Tax=Deinococcus irradiatisoli TaxID=2202254 RepID=A0A2Z3JCS0_9DEIO|nr:MOSC domain-containing protein [Deinococcus irradiatisoli]AWN22832.1 MOSC domain-containing protein [Deinococcus irradiatisoli]
MTQWSGSTQHPETFDTAPQVVAVSRAAGHDFSKPVCARIHLLAGLGVEGDAHSGVTVQHRSRVAADPTQPNLRQVHLIHAELLDELVGRGFKVAAGDLGENVSTRGLDLLGLPVGTRLHLGETAVVELTGLRNPCAQIEAFGQARGRAGLLAATLDHDAAGQLIRKAGVMGVVIAGGEVRAGDLIEVEWPPQPWAALEKV